MAYLSTLKSVCYACFKESESAFNHIVEERSVVAFNSLTQIVAFFHLLTCAVGNRTELGVTPAGSQTSNSSTHSWSSQTLVVST